MWGLRESWPGLLVVLDSNRFFLGVQAWFTNCPLSKPLSSLYKEEEAYLLEVFEGLHAILKQTNRFILASGRHSDAFQSCFLSLEICSGPVVKESIEFLQVFPHFINLGSQVIYGDKERGGVTVDFSG